MGVDEQIPKNSPALSVMSRQGSSQSSAIQTSPTLNLSSHMALFPPSLYGAVVPGPNIGKPGVSHFPACFMGYGVDAPSLVSPSQSPHPPGSHIPRIWSTQRSQLASPLDEEQTQTMQHASPPVPPAGYGNVVQVSNQAPTESQARMPEQRAFSQIHQSQQQQQRHLQQQVLQRSSSPSLGTQRSAQYDEPVLCPVHIHNQAEIAVPIPRDHRQNPSEVLQKGVDEMGACGSNSKSGKEGGENAEATRVEEGYGEKQAGNALNIDGRKTAQIATANGFILGAGQNFGGVTDNETRLPETFRGSCSLEGSQLNINAPNFEPGKYQEPSVFSFWGNQQAHKIVGNRSLRVPASGLAMQARGGKSQPGRWNAEAPAFMPNTPLITAIPSREFSFSALRPSLRPDAPAFKPSDSMYVSGSELISEKKEVLPANKIFGDVNFSELARHPKSKAIPIMNPFKESESKCGPDELVDVQEDETGRLTQADRRQKRMRYANFNNQVCIQALSHALVS